MNKASSLLVLLVACFIAIEAASNPSMQYIQGVLRDQSPNTMADCRAISPSRKGSCGTANNTKGFWNTDFQMTIGYYKDEEYGLVGKECNANNGWRPPQCASIGPDKTPVYVYGDKQSPGRNIRSAASFKTWFHDSPYTKTIQGYQVPLKLATGNTYVYANSSQFPLDNLGWQDYCGNDDNNPTQNHNYGYCFEAHFKFGYQGGEVFKFTGDDDVWVFIDGRLVIDLGSLHTELSRSINLDDIDGLVKSTTSQSSSYAFDFFYCERHTIYSNMKITTSLVAFCSYYDWCGVCEGNGQSCCTQQLIDQYCDDKNLCTEDLCGVQIPPSTDGCQNIPKVNCSSTSVCSPSVCNPKTGKCETTNINCDDGNACTIDSCDPVTGCKHITNTCDDGNKCTTDMCDLKTGLCSNPAITCDDKDACTLDSCVRSSGCSFQKITCPTDKCVNTQCLAASGCSNTSIVCDDKNACTDDSCNPASGCSYKQKDCNDRNQCTIDTCDSAKGGCQYAPLNCDDNNNCTIDTCNSLSGCNHQPVICPDQKCKITSCSPTSGCTYTNQICDDKDPCTNDLCDATTGQCRYTKIECNDNSACTTDQCVAGKCVYTPVSCTDTNACTNNFCSNSTGCGTTPVNCEDGNDCTINTCNPASGCVKTDVVCDDKDACTIDTCNPQGGCQYTPRNCDDGKACTVDTCDSSRGCMYVPLICDDKSACTDDSCSNSTGCIFSPKVCNDNNKCTSDTCNIDRGCIYTNISASCDDGDKCTDDTCDAQVGCVNKKKICSSTDPCVKSACNPVDGKCVLTTLPASDCDKCTKPVVVDCSVTDKCFPKKCNPADRTCIPDTAVDCNDQNACTMDSCLPASGACNYTQTPCNDGDPCTIDSCDKVKGCIYTPMVCDDASVCTSDACVKGACVFTPLPCTDNDNCTTDSCDPIKGCSYKKIVCDDKNLCTTDSCDAKNGGACKFTPLNCTDTMACTIDTCDPASGCKNTPKVCDDSNVCTTDSCGISSGECVFSAIDCATKSNATKCDIVSCDAVKGCSKVAKNCDDNNPCTDDKCDASGACVNTPKAGMCIPCGPNACTWTDSCAPQTCNNVTLQCEIKNIVCNDNSMCTTDTCDGSGTTYKCNYKPIDCTSADLCRPATCNASVGCQFKQILCDDGNFCTDDSCETVTANGVSNGTCVFKPKSCPTADKCNPASCNITDGKCFNTPIVCDDNNLCTIDSCADGVCIFTPKPCSTDPCNPEACNVTTGLCVPNPIDCNDNNPCTVDTIICAVDNSTGFQAQTCSHTANITICDDGDTCTEDICDSSVPAGENPCRTKNVTCPLLSACYEKSVCLPGIGCTENLLPCARNDTNTSDYCKITKCDPYAGCTSEPRTCPNKDAGCYDSFCNNITRSCTEQRKSDFKSNKGKGGIICPLLYDEKAKAAAITGGALAGVIIGAVAAAALIGFGGKAGYDYLMAKNSPMGPVGTNPLYTQAATSGNNPMYSP